MKSIANFVQTTLHTPIESIDDVIRFNTPVTPFNAPPNPDGRTAYAVLIDSLSAPTKFEIVSYTRMANNRLRNVTRGVGGTSAQSWPSGVIIVQDIPASLVEPLGLESSGGQPLSIGNDGLAFSNLEHNTVAGKPQFISQKTFSETPVPSAPIAGTARLLLDDSSGDVLAHFSNGTTKKIHP